jgi:hypothetical protein
VNIPRAKPQCLGRIASAGSIDKQVRANYTRAAHNGAPGRIAFGRLLGVSVGLLGPPAGAWLAWPLMGLFLIGTEVMCVLTVIFTALFGSNRHCERAFRLLRWTTDRAEPAAPPVSLGGGGDSSGSVEKQAEGTADRGPVIPPWPAAAGRVPAATPRRSRPKHR